SPPLPLQLRAYHLFVTTACNARLSSNSPATACFSCRFSSSSCRSRRASLTSIPPYFAFQRYRLPVCDPVPPAQLVGSYPSFPLLQDGDDLFFVKTTLAHDSSSLALSGPSYMEKSHFRWTTFRGAGQSQFRFWITFGLLRKSYFWQDRIAALYPSVLVPA